MNQVTHEQKDQVMKTMAIVGFIAVIIFGVWLAVQIVSLMPKAFSSLASIADGVYNYQPAETAEDTAVLPDPEIDTVSITIDDFGGNNEDESDTEESVEDTTTEDEEEFIREVVVVDPKPTTPTPSVPSTPQFIETVTYSTPTSDPNGYVDLAVRIVAVGHLDSDGNFTQRSNMDNDARGAFQFEVKNIGTKTSDEWDLSADLTSGTTHDAPDQAPLKPQERVVFTLGYDTVGDSGISSIGATVDAPNDRNSDNDSFTWAVSVVE